MRSRLAATGLACTLAAASLAASLGPGPPPAEATQDYAKAEGKDCSHCHVNPKGAGPRNATGREYEANGHRFGVRSWTSDALRDRYLRACAALSATWYGEAAKLLDALAREEKLPGGLALVEATRERFRMFPRGWMRSAKALLAKGDRGTANALAFLAKLESQFPAADEGREAAKLLDEAAADDARKAAAAEARAVEKVRVLLLQGRTEWDLGEAAAARKLFDQVLADPRGKQYAKEIAELLSPPAK
jgi:hypothetical protein